MKQPIVDAHHHIWRQKDQPWLQGPTVPRIFGAYEAIKRDYPIEEYLSDIDGTGVSASVYVQTNWAPEQAVDEVRWVQSEADRAGWPHAIVSFIDLQRDDAPEVMRGQAQSPLMRGVRQQLHWHENPMYRFAATPDAMNSVRFTQNLARLQDHDWLFELQIFSSQMRNGAALAAQFPGIRFVLAHAGMLEDLSTEGRQTWREGMLRLAQNTNVYVKLSGLGTFIRKNDADHIADVVQETIDIFGAERCVWGSNFPIEKLWTSYGAIVSAIEAALECLDTPTRSMILFDNAKRLYRIVD
ncbi:amidohydrolase [Variibacter gotjawalensis]|uniref:Amidohydrolase n=1 Tax=Variibacter gotjawalensis TaxID=1333996 RepID=A0A0S3Q0Y2_9BRAD|nr:amidohydrolase family protein [Variibacter gotjawalensis]NIK47685.1 putative TIM-barrel fold metal-dependent hydrolase [Variibacter gotjawalensis]RZS49583.1 putative TIM-barrel fold metal-dependent hydrolase [Variibacter gotjawalensis]BAT61845.1 amidohydrolase [Variibacter gotjawalensis]